MTADEEKRHIHALALNLLPDAREGRRELTDVDIEDVRIWCALRVGRARREHEKSLDQYRKKRRSI